MPESFGARVRQQREDRGIALRTVAEQTKIKLSLLEGLERDDLSNWPAGIFQRAYVRAYAHAVGLDPDVVVREFLETHQQPVEVVETPQRTPRFRGLVGSAMGSLSRLRRDPVVETRPPVIEPPARLIAPDPAPTLRAEPQGTVGRVPATSATVPPAPESEPVETTTTPVPQQKVDPQIDFVAVAQLCTELGRVDSASQLQPLLRDAAKILDAVGLIVWVWDDIATELRPALAHGYSERVLAQLPGVKRDADNLTAAAFRAGEARSIAGSNGTNDPNETNGALAVPLLTPAGCAGVLAIELPAGSEHAAPVRAAATFFAAMLAQLVGGGSGAQASASEAETSARASSG
jgi:transcriptional regulator with XRE-family HTH domain